jgi:eukaryotic-like serine/threonine-protein kinase
MNNSAKGFDQLLDSVSEGAPVDWDAAASEAGDDAQRGQVRALREVSRIADFSRAVQRARPVGTAGAEAGPRRWGELMLLERVGAGVSGEVWRAWDPELEREVALKLLRPGFSGDDWGNASPLVDEGRALARVSHPNVVVVHGIDRHDGRFGLRMEFVRGVTLEQEIARRGALPPDEVARLGAALCRALAAVHSAGLVHRDVKPANLVRDDQGRIVLTDFGLGQRRFLAGDDATHVSGTPMFMAPERLAGEPATERGDLYAAGATLWSALAGRHPYDAHTMGELRAALAKGTPPLIAVRPELPAALTQVIERAMASAPADRFASAAQMAEALEAFGAGPDPRQERRPRITRTVWIAAGTAMAAALVAAWLAPNWNHRAATPGTSKSAPAIGTVVAPGLPVATSAAGTYSVQATLMRRGPAGSQPLADGDRVAPGDRLSLEFHATQQAWVYVLDEDERGERYLLYPEPVFDRRNPLAANETAVLPGPIGGHENAWTVTSRGGHEHILVVASPEPIAELDREVGHMPAPDPSRPVSYARVPAEAYERLRGIGGVAPAPAPVAPAHDATFERFKALAGQESGVHGVWVRQVTLVNPLR